MRIWLKLQWSKVRRFLARDKSRWTRLYKTGTREQIGWHYRTDDEIDSDGALVEALKRSFHL